VPQAKLSAPVVHSHIVSRKQVLEKLQHIPEYRLTSVVAPAGYGKTTAVLDWLATCGLPAAWLSLDAYANNPAAFWQYLGAALDHIVPGLSGDTEYVLSSRELLEAQIQVNIIIDRLDEIKSDFLLVLDDLHLISDPAILQGLSCLIDYLPSSLHLILISRREPELKLARHKITGQMLCLDERDLLFDEEDIFNFYQARGYTLTGDKLKQVRNYSEGWAAALVAVSMSMDHQGGGDTIAALARSSRDIGQYLKDEVINSWQPDKLAFAVKTSILDTLSAPLCDAVTGEHNAGQMLQAISNESGFLMMLDSRHQQYRYHHLFGNFLKGLLADAAPAQITALHLRAAHWFEAQGQVPKAIEHLLSGNAYAEAFELIERWTDYLIHQNDFGILLSWLERLPEELLAGSFQAAFIYSVYYADTGRYDLSRQWLATAKERSRQERYSQDPAWSRYIATECMLAEAGLLLRQGDAEGLSLILSAAANNEARHFIIPKYFDLNTADIYLHRCPLNETIEVYAANPDRYEKMMARYREMLAVKPGYHPLIAGEYLYESNQLDQALPYLLNAHQEAREAGCLGALVPAMVHLALIRRARGNWPGAMEALEECQRVAQGLGKPHWQYLLAACRCRLNLESGAAEAWDAWFNSRKFNIYAEISNINEFELIVYSRALLAKGRLDDAGLLLKRLLAFCQAAARRHSEVEILNLLALTAYRQNAMPDALAYLRQALAIGKRKGYCRSFLHEGGPMTDLLRYFLSHRGTRAGSPEGGELAVYARELLLALQAELPAAAANGAAAAKGPAGLLTPQEQKVLELLAKAYTNAEIAARLCVSVSTVKTHIGNIYSKLGVKNRAQCMKLTQKIYQA